MQRFNGSLRVDYTQSWPSQSKVQTPWTVFLQALLCVVWCISALPVNAALQQEEVGLFGYGNGYLPINGTQP